MHNTKRTFMSSLRDAAVATLSFMLLGIPNNVLLSKQNKYTKKQHKTV